LKADANILNKQSDQLTRGGPPAWGLGELLETPHRKNMIMLRKSQKPLKRAEEVLCSMEFDIKQWGICIYLMCVLLVLNKTLDYKHTKYTAVQDWK
jgi:hypothetical protein